MTCLSLFKHIKGRCFTGCCVVLNNSGKVKRLPDVVSRGFHLIDIF